MEPVIAHLVNSYIANFVSNWND